VPKVKKQSAIADYVAHQCVGTHVEFSRRTIGWKHRKHAEAADLARDPIVRRGELQEARGANLVGKLRQRCGVS